MRYNLKRNHKKNFAFALALLILLCTLVTDCFASEDETVITCQEKGCLFLDVSVSEGGGCVEVILSSSRGACGLLATFFYDSERFSFLTFAKSDTLSEQVTVSCCDSTGRLRILIDADENFEGGRGCRFFFSMKQEDESLISKPFSEITVSAEAAYELSESGYSEICFEGASTRFDLQENWGQGQTNDKKNNAVSVQWIDYGANPEKCCTLCISGFADSDAFAAGFEVTASYENVAESYTVSRVLPSMAEDKRGYTAIILLPFRQNFYVTVRAIRYSARDTVRTEEIYCFFVSDSGIERVGSDR